MRNKLIFVILTIVSFLLFLIFYSNLGKRDELTISEVISPVELKLSDGSIFVPKDIDSFDAYYSGKNKEIKDKFNLTEDEAFIMGVLGKYWVMNLMNSRTVEIVENDLIFNRQSYTSKLKKSSFGLKDGTYTNKKAFERQIKSIRNGHYVLVDIDNDRVYSINKVNVSKIKKYVVIRKSHFKKINIKNDNSERLLKSCINKVFNTKGIKIILSDETEKLKPDRDCSHEMCKELIRNINKASKTIDMAVYGYSSIPKLEIAIKDAISRGVKIRMVYDIDPKGENIYPETFDFVKLVTESNNDKSSKEVNRIMHNKFYIFDDKTVITGSANLSHTDMSGFNSNVMVIIDSPSVANIYKNEFNQMFNGNFHNDKKSLTKQKTDGIEIYFSPQDKPIQNAVLPLMKNSKQYIFVSAFIITDSDFVKELINAKLRGVDVRVIVDALNAFNKYSRHNELRLAKIPVKAENYAGKMHSKTIIIDNKYLAVGSMNFSKSGNTRNDENIVIISNPDAAMFYQKFFLYQWNKISEKWLKRVPRAEGKDSIGSCNDGVDNNYDGFIDSEDSACKS